MKTLERVVYDQVDVATVDEQNDFDRGNLPVDGAQYTIPLGNRLGHFALDLGGRHFFVTRLAQ